MSTHSEVLCLSTQTLPLEATVLSTPDVSLERVQFLFSLLNIYTTCLVWLREYIAR